MDTENEPKSVGDLADETAIKTVKKSQLQSSPRKRAFREINYSEQAVVKAQENQPDEKTEQPCSKRYKLRTKHDALEPFTAHVAWSLDAGSDGDAMLVEDSSCFIGTNNGQVIECDQDGGVKRQWSLSLPVGALLRDSGRLYAWCRSNKSYDRFKGALMDLSFESPQMLFELKDFGSLFSHAAMVDGCLALCDDQGTVVMLGCDGKIIWKNEQPGMGTGGFFSVDDSGVYVVHKKHIRRYDLESGHVVWEYACAGGRGANISGGCEYDGYIFVETDGSVVQLNKVTGKVSHTFTPHRHQGAGACAGNGKIITGNNPTAIFDLSTKTECYRVFIPARLDQGPCQFSNNSERLYIFWDKLYSLDFSDKSLKSAQDGDYRRTYSFQVKTPPRDVESLANTDDSTLTRSSSDKKESEASGVTVRCSLTETEGDLITVYPVSEQFHVEWPVMFPVGLRRSGQRYIVDELIASQRGSFYRVAGSTLSPWNVSDTSCAKKGHVGTPTVDVVENKNSDARHDMTESDVGVLRDPADQINSTDPVTSALSPTSTSPGEEKR